jgi:hypothetical protein
LGRYYSTQGSDLYIWVTGEDELIDLNVFPRGLNLFEADSAWRSSLRMAVSEGVAGEALGVAEMILSTPNTAPWRPTGTRLRNTSSVGMRGWWGSSSQSRR